MTIQKLRPSFTFTQDRLAELQAVIPEAFADGAINWEVLKEALGDYLEDESGDTEHFGLSWPGKREARRLAAMASKGTLKPAHSEGIDEDTTGNIFIEGDNLEVLKLLQKSYAGRIKMIYIDPPYNTGNDFVYKDDFREPLEAYLEKTGEIDETGKVLTTNTRANGRFHSNWLSMIYPRLRLARNLLREDGVIFVSIDDNEAANLRLIMNEIFGEENFAGQIAVQLNPRGRHLDRFLAKTHEYLIVYVRDYTLQSIQELAKDERMAGEYKKSDKKGQYRELELRNRNPAFNKNTRPNLYYPIYADPLTNDVFLEADEQHTVEIYPKNSSGQDSCWTWGKDKFRKDRHLLVGRQINEGGWRVFRKDYFIGEDGQTATTLPKALWLDKEINNDYGKKALQDLFENRTLFDFPKSPALIAKILQIGTDKEGIVLDFFAGSATTAQAVLELNREDNGRRKFLCVQLSEITSEQSDLYKADYYNIADFSKERIRRVVTKMLQVKQGKLIEQAGEEPEDLGFKVFKLDRSNYKAWHDYQGEDAQEIETFFNRFETPLVEGWTSEGLLIEILLLQGFPLDSTVARQDDFEHNNIVRVYSEACSHYLFVCLDNSIVDDTIEQLHLRTEDVFICLDSALSDQGKMRLTDICNLSII